jgi:hypothetical protein
MLEMEGDDIIPSYEKKTAKIGTNGAEDERKRRRINIVDLVD